MKIVGSPVYLDTSALSKLYVPELESEVLERAMVGRRDLLVSDLGLTELTSALARRVRDGDLAEVAGRRVYRRVLQDARDGVFRVLDLTAETHRGAERLLLTIGRSTPLRAADALHLALAVTTGATVLITFDQHLTAAAQALGTLELLTSG